ncbi:hypothetical protein NE691_11490 [Enterococcus faecalis]|uniref:hypothetical protein n=1 Tax=Enterococcus faecalis TaxID=1351 RepID=UPI00210ACC4F|nr:hypothetical protein [Enterococcus faecalis]MCQ4859151.1 hypothetical protein [Enterococcus faecalis]
MGEKYVIARRNEYDGQIIFAKFSNGCVGWTSEEELIGFGEKDAEKYFKLKNASYFNLDRAKSIAADIRMACDDPIQVVPVKIQPGKKVYHVLKDNNVVGCFKSQEYATDFVDYQSTISAEKFILNEVTTQDMSVIIVNKIALI